MSDLHLHILGSAGYHPNDTRHTACLLIPEVGLMLDAGTGLYRSIPLLQTRTLDIVLSHAHLDHVFGLSYLLDVVQRTQLQIIRVWGEAAKLAAIRQHLFHELLFPAPLPVEWKALEEQSDNSQLCGARFRWFPLQHPGGSVGYRFDWPNVSLAYVTDTLCQPQSSYWRWLDELHYLVHECNFRDAEADFANKTGHSHLSPVLERAAEARIGHLILTHLNPLLEGEDPLGLGQASRGGWPKQVSIARDHQRLPLHGWQAPPTA
jgi:ribonuclease BN (tRNA processing enzyme)